MCDFLKVCESRVPGMLDLYVPKHRVLGGHVCHPQEVSSGRMGRGVAQPVEGGVLALESRVGTGVGADRPQLHWPLSPAAWGSSFVEGKEENSLLCEYWCPEERTHVLC